MGRLQGIVALCPSHCQTGTAYKQYVQRCYAESAMVEQKKSASRRHSAPFVRYTAYEFGGTASPFVQYTATRSVTRSVHPKAEVQEGKTSKKQTAAMHKELGGEMRQFHS